MFSTSADQLVRGLSGVWPQQLGLGALDFEEVEAALEDFDEGFLVCNGGEVVAEGLGRGVLPGHCGVVQSFYS